MAYYRSAGNIPHKRHVQHRDPEGKLYYEELMGEEGFSSDSSLLYHSSSRRRSARSARGRSLTRRCAPTTR